MSKAKRPFNLRDFVDQVEDRLHNEMLSLFEGYIRDGTVPAKHVAELRQYLADGYFEEEDDE